MDKEIVEKFKSLEPYKNTVVRNPWETGVIDVETIHEKPFNKVIHLVNYVKKNGNATVLVLQGEPGSGKSHLLWRISKNAEEKRFIFVNIVPYISVSGISYATILQSIIESLFKKHPNLKSRPVDHLIGWTIKQGLGLIEKKDIERNSILQVETILSQNSLPYVAKSIFETIPKATQKALKEKIKTALIHKYVDMPHYFFHILILLMDEKRERLTIDLLKGEELSNTELKQINIAGGFVVNEEVAYKILVSILNFSPFPFVISIDQIETIDKHLKRKEITNFFEKIIRLYSNASRVLFLLSVQTQTFKKWEKFLPVNIVERLSERTTILPLKMADAKEIVKKRNSFYLKKLGLKKNDKFYPFKENDIERLFVKGNKNPRRLIKAIDNLLETGTIGIHKDTIEEMTPLYVKQSCSDDFNRELTDLIIKITKMSKILKKTSTYTIVQIGRKAIVVNDSIHSLYSSVKNLCKAKENRITNEAFLIRSTARKIKSTARKSIKLIEKYNIQIVYIEESYIKNFIAISKMLRDAESQDIDIETYAIIKYAEKYIKNKIPEIFETVNAYSKKPAEKSIQKEERKNSLDTIEEIISQYRVITYSKLSRISKIKGKELNNILNILASKGKIRTMARGQAETWIFNNEI
jgi:DNA polymerase III delta prime subunit